MRALLGLVTIATLTLTLTSACSGEDGSGTAGPGAGGAASGGAGGSGWGGSSEWPDAGSDSGWPGTGGAAGGGGSGGSGGLTPLDCDPRFKVADPATVGLPFDVTVTDSSPYVYVDLEVSGPGSPATAWDGVAGSGPWSWTWKVSGHGAGVLDLTFKKDKNGNAGTTVATCQLHSIGAGGTTGGGGGGGGTGATGGSSGTGGATSGPPPANRYGMGLVNQGDATDVELTSKLAGPGGWYLVIFADVTPNRTSADASWKASIQEAYAKDLIPVIRMAPPWGDRRVRNMGESPTAYKQLAQAYKAVLQDLPKRADWPLYVQVHNEPNLCDEWQCDAAAGTLSDRTMASEYAHLLSDVADALHSIGDPRIKVLNGALAPGGAAWCQCGTSNFAAGTLSATFLTYMNEAVPGVFDEIDAFASHSYPAKGEGWGFFVAYAEAATGLKYFERELAAIGKGSMKVVITETGWPTNGDGQTWSRDQVGDFTVDALENVWLTHPNIIGVTPFILRDAGTWDKFAWASPDGSPYPVYTKVRAHRCAQAGAKNCD
ncbi:MAG: hypothetical protein OZ928_07475 [Polyangiaceae bacterium]|nr:hypothetical protein [Polyangiaceae bacterium]